MDIDLILDAGDIERGGEGALSSALLVGNRVRVVSGV